MAAVPIKSGDVMESEAQPHLILDGDGLLRMQARSLQMMSTINILLYIPLLSLFFGCWFTFLQRECTKEKQSIR
jgi:hypothetical protein